MLNYITIKPELMERQIVETDQYWWSRKLDGHFVRIQKQGDELKFNNKSGRTVELSHIKISTSQFEGELFGELVVGDGKTCTNADVSSAIASGSTDLRIFLFAAKDQNGILPISKFVELSIEGNNIQKVEWNKVTSRSEIRQAFDGVVTDKGEGLVVATETGFVYKLKPIQTVDLVVVGYSLNVGENAGTLRDLLLGVMDDENKITLVARTSSGINSTNGGELLKTISTIHVKSNYTEVSSAKTAFVFIEPKLIAQCTCLDIQGENASGTILKPVLTYSAQDGFLFAKDGESVAISSLVFQNLRTDKMPNAEHAGWNQLKPFLGSADDAAEIHEKLPSTVELKEVFSKDSKNGLAVRKLVLLKTNKESSGKFTSYINFYTDYSPGRKSPIETDIYLHHSLEEAKIKFLALKEENIKKGWEKVN